MSDQARLDIGGVIGETFRTYGAQAGLILGAAFVIFLPIAIVDGFIENQGGFLLSVVGSIISIVGTYWFQGMVVQASSETLGSSRRGNLTNTEGSTVSS